MLLFTTNHEQPHILRRSKSDTFRDDLMKIAVKKDERKELAFII